MTKAPFENINMTEADISADIAPGAGDRQYPPLSAQGPAKGPAWRGESSFVDSSGPIFSMYMEMAEDEDKKMAETWKADAEGILVFTGLFSAAVASLISVSIQDIRQNPQDTSNFYLANIYQATIAGPNRSDISGSLPTSPPPFSPPTYAVWVNSLWFLSLVISITCALLATLLQQWARRYLKVTQTRSSLHKRARIRSFFAEGVKESHLLMIVEALPMLLHVSLALFFAGLAVFVWNVNLTIFKVVLSWISFCTALYGCMTLIPVFRHNSPYYSPLTSLARPVVVVILYAVAVINIFFYSLVIISSICFGCRGLFRIFGHLHGWFFQTLDSARMTPEKAALKSSSEIDTRALTWTFDSLDEDHELDRFFSGLPGFHNSRMLKEPLHGLDDEQKLRLLEAVIRLLDRTFSSNSLPDQVKRQRADICANAIDLVDSPGAFPELIRKLASEDGYGPVQSTEIVQFVQRWGNRKGEDSSLDQAIFSIVVARVQQHDESWFSLASDQLDILETVLRSHAAHGDNLPFAILIYITRQQFSHIGNASWPSNTILDVLSAASNFNVEDTSPELQHEFCALWNQAVRKAQDDSNWKISKRILKPIRHVYIRLHHDTNSAPTHFSASTSESNDILDDPDSYPVCNVAGHVHGGSASISHPHPVLHDDAVPSPISLTSLDPPSFPLPSPFLIDEIVTTAPPLNNSHPTLQTAESFRVIVAPPDPSPAGALQDIDTSGITVPHPTSETPTPAPLSSTASPAALSLQHHADPLTPSSSLKHPPSPNPDFDNIISTEPQRSVIVTPASPGPTSVPSLGAAVDEDGMPKLGLPKQMDAPDPLSINRAINANTAASRDLTSPSPLSSVPDSNLAIAGRSLQESNAEHTGDPPNPSRCQYDMV